MKSRTAHSAVARIPVTVNLFGLLIAMTVNADQKELAASIGQTRREVMQTRDQLHATVVAIERLTKQKSGDMRPTYDAFTEQIARTTSAANLTKARVEKMGAEASAHFSSWQKNIDAISNPSLKKKAQKRLYAVQKGYNEVISQLKEASSRFKPSLSGLGDIQKTLASDLTPSGVKSVRSSVNDAQWNLKLTNRAITDAITELDEMEKSLGTIAEK